jgi:SCP-2 sterol transfer family protein
MVFVLQAGPNKHEHICESLELFGQKVLPPFAAEVEAGEHEKSERLAPAVEAALARREPPRQAPPGYVIDEPAEIERAARARRRRLGLRERMAELAGEARASLGKQGRDAVARLVRGASDAQLERRFGNGLAQRAIFTGMARQFNPKFAFGFEGDIVYELEHYVDGASPRPSDRWTLRVRESRAELLADADGEPAVKVRVSVPDFARLVANEVDPGQLLFDGRFYVEGDYQVASRLTEMFGGPSRF